MLDACHGVGDRVQGWKCRARRSEYGVWGARFRVVDLIIRFWVQSSDLLLMIPVIGVYA